MRLFDLPPLAALRAFAALAQTGSVSAAGEALNVSHSAISQHVKGLENRLRVKLIQRDGRGVVLTPEGALLAQALQDAFAGIATSLERIADTEALRPLQVTTTPNFAANWLMPRLADFTARYPEHELMLNPSPELATVGPGQFDLAIRFGDGRWPGFESELLLPSTLSIVGARKLVGDSPISRPADLLDYPWLQETGSNEVSNWLRENGVTSGRVKRMTHLPGAFMMDAVRRGEGVSAVATTFAEGDIRAGGLRVLFETSRAGAGYYLVTAQGVQRPAVRDFVRWLRRQRTA